MTASGRVLSVLLCGLAGCVGLKPASDPGAAADVPRPGVVFVVGGIGGIDWVGPAAECMLPKVGVPHEVRNFVWTHGVGLLLKDLQDTPYLLKKADDLAEEVRRIKADDPDRPVYLVGKSGGTALVLAAAEQLPADTLERIVLLSAAVSPTYDLRGALRASKGGVVSFHCCHDKLVLGWGTSQFGTADRFYGPSAGLTGFCVPDDLSEEDRRLFERLVQIPWSAHMILEGNPGAHFGTSMPRFVAREVAPWLVP